MYWSRASVDGLEVPRLEPALAQRPVDVGAGPLVGAHLRFRAPPDPTVDSTSASNASTVVGVLGLVRPG